MSLYVDARRALVAVGPNAVLCGRTAAVVHGLSHDPLDQLEVLIPWGDPRPRVDGVRLRQSRGTGRRPPVDTPLPHTDIVDTVLDLADHTDRETCVYWLTEAHRRGLLTMADLLEGLAARRRHTHRTLIEEIADDVASGATSNLEVRYVRQVERAHRLPTAERQFIVPETGHRADFAYPRHRRLIETDGLAYHQGEAAERDARIDAEHAAAGWSTIRLTWTQVAGTPCLAARTVADAICAEVRPCSLERQDR